MRLSGIVHTDEGKLKAVRGTVGETAGVGANERGGNVTAKPVPATDAVTFGRFVEETVEPGTTVYTNGSSFYKTLRA